MRVEQATPNGAQAGIARERFLALTRQDSPLNQKTTTYWEEISTSPEDLRGGLQILADEVASGSNDEAKAILTGIFTSKIPSFLKGVRDRLERYGYAKLVSSTAVVLIADPSLAQKDPLVLESVNLLTKVLPDSLRDEETVFFLDHCLTQLSSLPNEAPARRETLVPLLAQQQKRLFAPLLKPHQNQAFNERNLRLAAAGHLTQPNHQVGKVTYFTDIPYVSADYLTHFRAHFERSPRGYIEGLRIFVRALQANPYFQSPLLGILTGVREKTGFHVSSLEAQTSFVSFLHRLITDIQARGKEEQQATKVLELIIDNSFGVDKDDVYKTTLLASINASNVLSTKEKLVIGKTFFAFLERYGFKVSLSDEEILGIIAGPYAFSAELAEEGEPIVLANYETGEPIKTIGYFTGIGEPTPRRRHRPRRRKTGNAAPTVTAEQVHKEQPTREALIQQALRAIFLEMSDEQLNGVQEESDRLWEDIDPKSSKLKRIATLSPLGTRVRLHSDRLVAAPEGFYPAITIRSAQPAPGRSDLAGIIHLGNEVAFSFFIDSSGYLQGEIADLANQQQFPFDMYWQINNQVLRLFNQKLTGEEGELDKRFTKVVARATDVIMTGGTASSRKIAEQLRRSEPYLIEVTRQEGIGRVVRIEIDKERIRRELSAKQSMLIFQPLTQEELQESARRKGGAKPSVVDGRVVFLPFGQHPRRIAIENATRHNVTLVKVTGFFKDPDGSTLEIPVYTTFRSTFVRGTPP